MIVVRNQLRARQIRTRLAAAGIAPVTKCAMFKKQRLSVFNLNSRKGLDSRLFILTNDTRGLHRRFRALRAQPGCYGRKKDDDFSLQLCTFRINRGMLAARSSGVARTKSDVERAGGFFAFGSTFASLIFSSIARF